jgi:hypothetical protein
MRALLTEALGYIVTMAQVHGVDPEQKDLVRRIRAELDKRSDRQKRLPEPHPGPNATDKVLHAYYKRVSPYEDLLFVRKNASPELRIEIDALIAKGPTHADAMRIFTKRRIEATYTGPAKEKELWAAVRAGKFPNTTGNTDDPVRGVAHLKERNQRKADVAA